MPLTDLRECKRERVAVLADNYLNAAAALVGAHPGDTDALVRMFDQTVTTRMEHGVDKGECERTAYIALAKVIERRSPSDLPPGKVEVSR